MDTNMKTCKICGETKDASDFGKASWSLICSTCRKLRQKANQAKFRNSEHGKKKLEEYKERTVEHRRKYLEEYRKKGLEAFNSTDPSTTKTCTKCGETKPITEFYRNIGSPDGHRPRCKQCEMATRALLATSEEFKRMNTLKSFEWRHKYPEKYFNAYSSYNERVKERKNEWQREYSKSEAGRLSTQKAAEKRKAVIKETITKDDLSKLINFFGGKCLCCGSEDVTTDHIVPIAHGGKGTIDNLQILCGQCNNKKKVWATDYRIPYLLEHEEAIELAASDPLLERVVRSVLNTANVLY